MEAGAGPRAGSRGRWRGGAARCRAPAPLLYFRFRRRRRRPFGGGIAQLGERLAGSQKVRGSNPLTSTTSPFPPVRPRALLTLVFFAGIGSMATEICASRLLAPFYGSSTVVWANIIGLVLASLSLGYWLGGRLADRRPSPILLGRLVLAGAALVAVIPFVAGPLLELSVRGIDTVSVGAVVGSFAASLALFAPPVVLLGMVTPFAIRLGSHRRRRRRQLRRASVFALSTLGSLLGTFVPALVTIPLIGTQRTLIGAAAIIAAAAVPVLGRRWALAPARAGRPPARPARGREADAGPRARGGVALPVHPGRRARRRATPLPQRGARGPLGLARRRRS